MRPGGAEFATPNKEFEKQLRGDSRDGLTDKMLKDAKDTIGGRTSLPLNVGKHDFPGDS